MRHRFGPESTAPSIGRANESGPDDKASSHLTPIIDEAPILRSLAGRSARRAWAEGARLRGRVKELRLNSNADVKPGSWARFWGWYWG
jgi:hypothetical protein